MFKYETNEDGIWHQNTEGRCMNCGEWVEYREKLYGMWVCQDCAESEQFND